MYTKAKNILKDIFGYDNFRPIQGNAIESILNKNDTMVIMPTGGGKSLCYQIPALIFDGLTIVVSPLISLMKDQVEQLSETGVTAVFLNSTLSREEYSETLRRLRQKEIKLLYMAPETLLKPNLIDFFSNMQISCVAVDEAHCISEWGHDFRPEYRQLVGLKNKFTGAVWIALTATATLRVRDDIAKSLDFSDNSIFLDSFNRENLFIQIIPKISPVNQVIKFIEKFPDRSGIIYCQSRKQVDNLSEILKDEEYSALPYHAGLSTDIRQQNQVKFIKDEVRIIVATIAFGMGINKPDVRFIVHFDLPQNIETYYQQIGRAGRDGLRAHCLLLFGYGDINKIEYFIEQKSGQEQIIARQHLNDILEMCESRKCRRLTILAYFGEKFSLDSCDMCDNCSSPPEDLVDITVNAQKFLSCIKRSDEKFGMNHIIDVLRGSKNQKILKFGHDKLSTYNIGNDLSKKEWQYLAQQFIKFELINVDREYGSLYLSDKSWDVLRSKRIVMGTILPTELEDNEVKIDNQNYNEELYKLLKQKRMSIAREKDIPPYMIFSDASLIEMAKFYPSNKEEMLAITGVGQFKYSTFGKPMQSIINNYCENNNIDQSDNLLRKRIKQLKRKSNRKSKGKKFLEVGKAFQNGQSIKDLKRLNNVKDRTIINHLKLFFQEGNDLDSLKIEESSNLSTNEKARVKKAFVKHGLELLRPVYDECDGEISYDELAIIQLSLVVENSKLEK